jgi:hypothetical protein
MGGTMQIYHAPTEAVCSDAHELENCVTAELIRVYLASDVDALLASHVVATDQSNLHALHDRIAELEKALRLIQNHVMCPHFFREIASKALMVSE